MNRLGQVFLKDKNILNFIASQVENGVILEIGGGDGRLSKLLKNKGYLIVVEIDKRFKSRLNKIADHLIIDDFLHIEPFSVDYIVGNIPYYISSKILFRLLDWDFKEAILMFQKEFIDKMLMKPGEPKYGRLSVTSQYYFDIKYIKFVDKRCFSPIPKVDSGIVKIKKRNSKNKKFDEVVKLLFSHKNKKIKNIIENIDIYREERPDNLSLKQIEEIVERIKI